MASKIRIGLVGLNFGRHICRALISNPNLPVELTRLCDLDAAKAEALSTETGVPTSPSLDALLADPEIDAIGLYTGPNGRADLIRKIIRAGKDVMTTKPFEVDPDAAMAVLAEAKALGRVVHMNSPNPRPFGEMAIINKWISEGEIGRPVLAQASVWAYYGVTPKDDTWYNDPLKCPVAPIFRLGIYPLNSLLTIFGEPDTVQVTHTRIETQRQTPDNASLTIAFRNGGIVNLVASFVVGGKDFYKNSMTISGTKGVIYYAVGPDTREGDTPCDRVVTLSTAERTETEKVTEHAGDYDWDFFARRIRGEFKDDVTTSEDIVRAIRVVRAMSEAELSGQKVTVR